MLQNYTCFAIALCLLACGGSTTPKGGESAPPSTESQASSPDEGAPAAEPAANNLEGQRDAYVKSCLANTPSQDFCNCSFEQFKEVFKDADLSKPLAPDDPHVAQLKEKTASACTSKLSEVDVKDGFTRGCAAGDERKNAYCACAWSSLRKKLPYTALIGSDEGDPQIAEAKKGIAVDCKGKLPADVAKFEFMKGCAGSESRKESACECMWTKLKAKFSPEQIVTGTADVASVKGLSDCK